MKQTNNNEVDVLLRSFARRAGRPSAQPDSGDGRAMDHLDADELNSYAEGVVPTAARSRYTEHLVDCDACRGMVVSLSQSAGAAGAFTISEVPAESNFWLKLSAFFSPAVLRYAVPALVLTLVIGIGLFALRPQGERTFIAQNKTSEVAKSEETATKMNQGQIANTEAPPSGLSASSSPTSVDSRRTQVDQEKKAAEAPVATGASNIAKAPIAKDGVDVGEISELRATQPYAMEPKAAPPPATVLSDADKAAGAAQAAPEKREDQQRSRDAFKMQREEEHGPSRSQTNAPSVGGRAGALMSNRGPSDPSKNKAFGNVESRTVSGRRFIRENNAWVDTEYDSSRSTIRVTRSSDQFRALVADEPGIRAISEQLSGVVIVVWKNRAYRIQ